MIKTVAIEFATNIFGLLDDRVKEKLYAVIENPCNKTWEEAYSIILNGRMTLWQAVLEIDSSFVKRKPIDAPWAEIPSSELIIEAIRFAVFNETKILN